MHTISVTPRGGGEPRLFTANSQAEAFDSAFAWMLARHDVVTTARQLLDQIGDVREMLEECNESGETAEAFAALEAAVNAASMPST